LQHFWHSGDSGLALFNCLGVGEIKWRLENFLYVDPTLEVTRHLNFLVD